MHRDVLRAKIAARDGRSYGRGTWLVDRGPGRPLLHALALVKT